MGEHFCRIAVVELDLEDDLLRFVRASQRAVDLDGRDTERDLYGNRGRYVRMMDSKTKGLPCPQCGTPIVKIQYLGGACYLCPDCQT